MIKVTTCNSQRTGPIFHTTDVPPYPRLRCMQELAFVSSVADIYVDHVQTLLPFTEDLPASTVNSVLDMPQRCNIEAHLQVKHVCFPNETTCHLLLTL